MKIKYYISKRCRMAVGISGEGGEYDEMRREAAIAN